MSKPKYKWWSYIRRILSAYPSLCEKKASLQAQIITQAYDAARGRTEPPNPTESAALRMLPEQDERELSAVKLAIDIAQRRPDGDTRISVINYVFFKHTHTLEGAAQKLHISYEAAKRIQQEFIYSVAKNLGLL